MRRFVLYCVLWTLLALFTVLLAINNGNPWLIAATAWVGGIVTALIAFKFYWYKDLL